MERSERRKRRSGIGRVALTGYTNAGKSTIMNLLTGAGTRVENRLFVTLDALVRRCERGGKPPFLLIDTVGFIRKLPHHLVASFRSTLEEAADADLLLHVVDASSDSYDDQMRSARATLTDLGVSDYPTLLVFNKVDRAAQGLIERLRVEHPEAVFMSAIDPSHADRLMSRVRAVLSMGRTVPVSPAASADGPVAVLNREGRA